MKGFVGFVIGGLVGAAAGAAGTYIFCKKKFEKEADAYIRSQHEEFVRMLNEELEQIKAEHEEPKKEDKIVSKVPTEEKTIEKASIYIVDADDTDNFDFQDNESYGIETLMVTIDGVFYDNNLNALSSEDIEKYLGKDIPKLIDKLEGDIFVRNEDLMLDIDVIKTNEYWADLKA